MRSVKFRAWHNGQVWDVEDIRFVHVAELPTIAELEFWDNEKSERIFARTKAWEIPLMQYTGLKDKNGVEIYEGDVVDDLNHEGRGVVVWQNDSCDYELEDANGTFIQAFGFEKSLYEVIGNIYENPELLKGGDEVAE